MKSNSSLLTTAAKAVTDQTVDNTGIAVYQHMAGDWSQHTQVRVYALPYNLTSADPVISSVLATVYKKAKDTGTGTGDITMSNQYGTFTTSAIDYGQTVHWHWHPFSLGAYGVVFTGSLLIPSDGMYTFSLKSDDSSCLFIPDALTGPGGSPMSPVINNTGEHGPLKKTASCYLTAGSHVFTTKYREDGVGEGGVEMPLPAGVYFGSLVSNIKTLGSTTIRMAADVLKSGMIVTVPFMVPATIANGSFSPTHVPIIVTQPLAQHVAVGAQANFSVVAVSDLTMTYQWYCNGIAIENATDSAFTVPSVALTDAGDYYVVVSNSTGSATSITVTLSIAS